MSNWDANDPNLPEAVKKALRDDKRREFERNGWVRPDSKPHASLVDEMVRIGCVFGEGDWVLEHRFCTDRKWRFDIAHPGMRVAIEMDGLRYDGRGRHQTMVGASNDCEKLNRAVLEGWRVLRCTQKTLQDGRAMRDIVNLIAQELDKEINSEIG